MTRFINGTLRQLCFLSALTLMLSGSRAVATVDHEDLIEPLGVSSSAMLLFALDSVGSYGAQVKIFDLNNGDQLELCDVRAWGLGTSEFFGPPTEPKEKEGANPYAVDKARAKALVESEWGLKLVDLIEAKSHPNLKITGGEVRWDGAIVSGDFYGSPDVIYTIPGMESRFAILKTSDFNKMGENSMTTEYLHIIPRRKSQIRSCLSPGDKLRRAGKAEQANSEAKRFNQEGLELYRSGKKSEAISRFRKAIGMNSVLAPALVNYASALQATLPPASGFDPRRLEPWLVILYALHVDPKYTRDKLKTDPDFRSFQSEIRFPFRVGAFSSLEFDRAVHNLYQKLCGVQKVSFDSGHRFDGVLAPLSWVCLEGATYEPNLWGMMNGPVWPNYGFDEKFTKALAIQYPRPKKKTAWIRLSIPKRIVISSALLAKRELLIPFNLEYNIRPAAFKKIFTDFKKKHSKSKKSINPPSHPIYVNLTLKAPGGESWEVRVSPDNIDKLHGESDQPSTDHESYIDVNQDDEESLNLDVPVGDLMSLFPTRPFAAGDYTVEVSFLGQMDRANFSIEAR